jgi:hypothetical protein
MRSRSWTFGFPHSPAIAQVTLSSVKLCLLLNNLASFLCVYAFSGHFVSSLLALRQFLEPNTRFKLKMYSDVRDGVIYPD